MCCSSMIFSELITCDKGDPLSSDDDDNDDKKTHCTKQPTVTVVTVLTYLVSVDKFAVDIGVDC